MKRYICALFILLVFTASALCQEQGGVTVEPGSTPVPASEDGITFETDTDEPQPAIDLPDREPAITFDPDDTMSVSKRPDITQSYDKKFIQVGDIPEGKGLKVGSLITIYKNYSGWHFDHNFRRFDTGEISVVWSSPLQILFFVLVCIVAIVILLIKLVIAFFIIKIAWSLLRPKKKTYSPKGEDIAKSLRDRLC